MTYQLRDIQWRALAAVASNPRYRASGIGWVLWGESTPVPRRGEGSHGTNKFCRAAGKVLNQLQRLELIDEGTDGAGIIWTISQRGVKALQEYKSE